MTAKRDAILQAAKRLFAQSSYHQIGVDKISTASGASKMTLYSQFGSKEQLIVEVLRLRDEEFISSLRAAMNGAPSGIPRLETLFKWHNEWFRRPDFHGCMFIKASEEFAGQSETIMAVARNHKLLILEMIKECLVEARIKNPKPLARLLFTLTEGMIVNAHMFGHDQITATNWPEIEYILGENLNEGS
ncbi:TetR/AcrR family transcriptional regulator [Agrobacterium vitis]